MARSQYQYTAIVGPVWRAAVAASLAWLPAGNAQPTRTLAPTKLDTTVEPLFQTAAAVFDPAHLAWLPRAQQPLRELPRASAPPRTVGVAQEYDPASLTWLYIPAQPARTSRATQTWSLLSPFPVAPVVYDPALLSWMPAGSPFRSLALRHGRWDYTEVVAGLYDPAGLDWFYEPAQPQRLLSIVRAGYGLLDVFPRPPIPYNPVTMEWAPDIAWPLLTLPAIRTGAHILDPFPIPPSLPPAGNYLRFRYDP